MGIELIDTALTRDTYENDFLPLYVKNVVMGREYRLDLEEMKSKMLHGIEEKKYRILLAQYAGAFLGGLIYREGELKAFISQRYFDKGLLDGVALPISLDYYVERYFIDQKKEQGLQSISHGIDSHPTYNGIGLMLYKIKAGYKPMMYEKAVEISYNLEDTLRNHGKCLIFHMPDEQGYYRKGSIYTMQQSPLDPHFIHELSVVFEWAGIELDLHEETTFG